MHLSKESLLELVERKIQRSNFNQVKARALELVELKAPPHTVQGKPFKAWPQPAQTVAQEVALAALISGWKPTLEQRQELMLKQLR